MHWALGRQLLYALGTLIILGVAGVFIFFSYFYKAPSCFDGTQNQNESGVDCGGSCALLCEAPQVGVVWARSVPVTSGVYHAVALVRNPDTAASGMFTYEVSLFDEDNILIVRRSGTFTIGPGALVPLFEANLTTGERIPARTFVTITPGVFQKAERTENPVRVVSWEFDDVALRLHAVIENESLQTLADTQVTALVFNAGDTLIGASQTQSGAIAPHERKTVLFTWQESFNEEPARIDIVPQVVEPQ